MRRHGRLFALMVLAASGAAARADEKPPARVGQIFIVGNETTPHSIFLDRLGLFPGQLLSAPDLETANNRLAWLRLAGLRCDVRVTEDSRDSDFKDLLIRVQESVASRLLFDLHRRIEDYVVLPLLFRFHGGRCR
jgi:outer membrane protein assembly factor BamA